MYYVKVEKGVNIAVYDLNPGGSRTIFFIHGWPVNHNMFEYQFNVLPKLGFRCVSIDLRGFGNSDAPWSGYSYDRLSDDVYEVIRSLSARHLILAGFSMGGAVAIRYMMRHRAYRVSKLALIAAAAPSFTKRPNYPYGMTDAQVDELIGKIYKNRPQMTADFGGMFFANEVTPSFSSWFFLLALQASSHATVKTAQSLKDENLKDDLSQIRAPTGIFHGALDRICPFEFAVEMNRGISNSQIYRFEQSGHGVFYDELEKFNEEFSNFAET